MNQFRFSSIARRIAVLAGRPVTFLVAVSAVLLWALSGPLFGFSDTWQLVINTTTTIITFLMVFLIQNTQNRDTLALQLKLSELVLSQKGAHNSFVDLDHVSDAELERMHADLSKRADHTLHTLHTRRGQKPAKTRGRARKK